MRDAMGRVGADWCLRVPAILDVWATDHAFRAWSGGCVQVA